MKQLFSNNARTTVAATFGATDTTLEVLDGSLFPVPNEAGQFFLLTLLRIDGSNQETGHEVIKCNARVGNTITVEQRSYEGAEASEFAVGAVVSARLTAKSLENLIAASIAAVELIYDNFDDRYLGAKEADPLTDNDGDPLEAGMLYFNTTALIMRVYGGGAWQDAASAIEGLGQTFQFTATEGQAEFSGNDDSGAELTFDSIGNMMVFLNGVRLVRSVDYTVNDVTKTITLIKPASDLDVLTVDAFSYFAMVPLADMPLAIAGQDNQSLMTPLRTAQAINAMPRKNYLINGNFDIWQRWLSTTTAGYSADRFGHNNGAGASTVSRQPFVAGQTEVPNEPSYFYRHSRTAAATSNNTPIYQRIEGVRTLAGEVATISFYAKFDLGKEFNVKIIQFFGTGGAPSSNVENLIGVAVGTGAWELYSFTASIPSIAGKTIGSNADDYLQAWLQEEAPYSTFTLDVAQIQFEKGEVATDFEQRSIGEELALCQRFYATGSFRVRGYNTTGGALGVTRPFPVTMRSSPAVSISILGSSNISSNQAQDIDASSFTPIGLITSAGNGTYIGTYTADAEL